MKKIVFLLCFVFAIQFAEAKKRALIIAIGDYPANTGWGAISSLNDVDLVKQSLLNQQFLNEDIVVLTNEQATKKGILAAMEKMRAVLLPGDILVIHYSGHGQQIFDDNNDEADGKDESLVPYDAFARYSYNYKGENHLRDDELGNIIAAYRNILKKNGQLLFILDSCHSGSATRGGKSRGGQATFAPDGWKENTGSPKNTGSAMLETVKINADASPFVIMSGASADELNYEYEGFGSLSYAFSKAMTDLGTNFTFRQLFSSISANMNVISPKQTPTIEGDVDYKLFKGEYTKQQPYFEVKKVKRENLITINGGKIQRLFNNTTVLILPAGTTKVTADKVITKGKITNASFNESILTLEKGLPDFNEKKYWVFIDTPSYGDISLKVFIDPTVEDKLVREGVASYLEKNQLGVIVKDITISDVNIMKSGNSYALIVSKGNTSFDDIDKSRSSDSDVEAITKKLFNFAQGQYLKNLSMKNYDYEFEFKLLPINFDEATSKAGDLKPESTNTNASEIVVVKEGEDHVVLQITNKSNEALYFSVIEINSKGEIAPFFPNRSCPLNNNERKIEAGKTMIYKTCVYSFSSPYERLMLKAFATTSPINFEATVTTRGVGTRGNAHPLEKFVQNTYTQSRGADGNSVSQSIDGFSAELIYEIVKK